MPRNREPQTTRSQYDMTGQGAMPRTRDFKDTVKARAARDPAFRRGLFEEAITALLDGNTETGMLLLRDAVDTTDEAAR